MGTSGRRGTSQGKGGNKLAVTSGTARTSKRNSQPTTVLFCEYSKGADLQGKLKGVANRLVPLVSN